MLSLLLLNEYGSIRAIRGLHDLYEPGKQGRGPIPLVKTDDRIGTIGIPIDPEK